MRLYIHADKSELAGKSEAEIEALRADPEPWPTNHVVLEDIPDGIVKLTPSRLEDGLKRGYIKFDGKRITFMTVPQTHFKVLWTPGRYCAHCGEKLIDDPLGQQARIHVLAKHAGIESPDPENPSGYRCDNFYACELED